VVRTLYQSGSQNKFIVSSYASAARKYIFRLNLDTFPSPHFSTLYLYRISSNINYLKAFM
jgi:hypothetical protein